MDTTGRKGICITQFAILAFTWMLTSMKALMNANVTIDSQPGVGTKVTVTIPKGEGNP